VTERTRYALDDAEAAELLASESFLVFATLRADGRPHLTSMRYLVVDGLVQLFSYGRAQKVRNVERDPRCSCLVEVRGSYSEVKGLEIVGRAEIIRDHDEVLAFARRMRMLLGGGAEEGQSPESVSVQGLGVAKRVVLRIHPERYVSWDHTKLASR
jgi:PPOX class probable F420-dependent enzyme